jgi:hypothetical protein
MAPRDAFGNELGADSTPTPSPSPSPSATPGPTPAPGPAPVAKAAVPRRVRGGGARRRRSGWFAGLAILLAIIRLLGVAGHHTTSVDIPSYVFTDPTFSVPTIPSTDDFPPIPTTPGEPPG